MRTQLEQRLQQLKSEFELGQKKLAEVEAQAANLRNTLLRISGAIQVLEEELAREGQTPEDGKDWRAEAVGAGEVTPEATLTSDIKT